jgi:hypothetical protein
VAPGGLGETALPKSADCVTSVYLHLSYFSWLLRSQRNSPAYFTPKNGRGQKGGGAGENRGAGQFKTPDSAWGARRPAQCARSAAVFGHSRFLV